MNKKKYQIFILTILSGVLMLGLILASSKYQLTLDSSFSQFANDSIDEVIVQQKFNLQMQLDNDIQDLRNISIFLKDKHSSEEEIISYLAQFIGNTNFDNLFYANVTGAGVNHARQTFDISNRDYFKKAIAGQEVMSDPVKSLIKDATVTPIAVPLYDEDGEICGVICGSYTVKKLQQLLVSSFKNNSITHIVDAYGDLVVTTDEIENNVSANLLEIAKRYDSNNFVDSSYEEFAQNLLEGKSGSFIYEYKNIKRYVRYAPADINDWFIVVVVPYDVIFSSLAEIQKDTTNMAIFIGIILFALCVVPIYLLQQSYKLLRQEREDLHRAIDLSGLTMMRYSPKTQEGEFYGKISPVYGDIKLVKNIEKLNKEKNIFDSESKQITELIKQQIESGVPKGCEELCLNLEDKEIWLKVEFLTVFNDNHEVQHALINITDITKEKNEKDLLHSNASKDSLTGLLNRATFEKNVVEEFAKIPQNEKMAMLFIDIDNFKNINDTKGHQHGDAILLAVSKHLQEIFSPEDMIGRIGGDEFVVFCSHHVNETIICEKTATFVNVLSDETQGLGVCVSVGIAFALNGKTNFNELYANADKAMYRQKNNGKNGFSVF